MTDRLATCHVHGECFSVDGEEAARSLTTCHLVPVPGMHTGALWAAGYSANEIARIIEQESREGG